MLFNSIAFLVFFPIVCICYYLLPTLKLRNGFLLIASYYFYMNWKPEYALLLMASTIITWLAGIGIGHFKEKSKKKACLVGSLVLNLGVLFVFKYYNFATENITHFLDICGISVQFPDFSLLLPIGISFYIFQALGYSIDVYRGNTDVERNFFRYALFVSFFPLLVAGPIERSTTLLKQFDKKHTFSYDTVMSGIKLMLWGYFLKLVLADRCALYVDAVFNNVSQHNGGSFLIASLFFPFQIYGDFAGYSLVAIGAAKVMGFRAMENFKRPYFSATITEFWQRWHISLSTWFRDYLYIPLGGNRVSKARNYFNIMATFIVSGIWHGANWTFLVWGTIHGALQCVEKALGWHRNNWHGMQRFLHMALTFIVVSLAWIFFRANSIGDAFTIIHGIFTNMQMPYLQLANFGAVFMALIITALKEIREEFGWNLSLSRPAAFIVSHAYIICIICYIILFGVLNGDQFIYFQF